MNITDITVATTMLTLMVVGATELVRRLFARDFEAAVLIAVAALIGGLVGAFVLPVIGFAVGICAGLSASGLITTAQNIGTKTKIVPTPPAA
jgi:uncharacterized protein YqgC (DUF456 family)